MGIQLALIKIQAALAKISPDYTVQAVEQTVYEVRKNFLEIKYTIKDSVNKFDELRQQQFMFEFIANVFRDLFDNKLLEIAQENGTYVLKYDDMTDTEKSFLDNLPESFFESLFIKAMEWSALSSPELQSQSSQVSSKTYQSSLPLLKDIASIQQTVVSPDECLYVGIKEVSEVSRKISKVFYVNGLPTIIMAEIKKDANLTLENTLCNLFVELVPLYSMYLSSEVDPLKVMKQMLEKINDKAQQWNKGQFSFSCAISYKDALGALKVAYLSVGDEVVTIQKTTDESIVLSENTSIRNVKMVIENIAIGDKIVVSSHKEPVTLNSTQSIGKNSLIAFATIPNAAEQQAINQECYKLYCKKNSVSSQKKAIEQYKQKVIDRLEQKYSWKPRLFGHHHHDRWVALCKAIRKAETTQQIQLLLTNQSSFSQSPTSVQPVENGLLNTMWSTTMKNRLTTDSGYLKAVQEALKVVTVEPLRHSF